MNSIPIICHIPHSSTHIPGGLVDWTIDSDELAYEVGRLTDWYTDELFGFDFTEKVIFPVSRLVCDPERFVDDAREPAAAVGMGVLYTHGSRGQRIANRPPDSRDRLLNQYFWPHHEALSALNKEAIDQCGQCWVIDCHSFPDDPLPTEVNGPRPDICIGVDEFHTPTGAAQALKDELSSAGYSVAINSPYSGTLIPNGFYGIDPRVKGMMIEVNRRVYLDEQNHKLPEFVDLKRALEECIQFLQCFEEGHS